MRGPKIHWQEDGAVNLANINGTVIPSLTISGVAFDGSGEYLAACSWSSTQKPGPSFLFRLEKNPSGLELSSTKDGRPTTTLRHYHTFSNQISGPDECSTGLAFLKERQLVVRQNTRNITNVLLSTNIPLKEHLGGQVDIVTNIKSRHRTHARIAVVAAIQTNGPGEEALTGGERRFLGLVAGPPPRSIHDPEQITAILSLPSLQRGDNEDSNIVITGSLSGTISVWKRMPREGEQQVDKDHEWQSCQRISIFMMKPTPASMKTAWANYKPQSIIGLCALEDGRFFSVDASGLILEWKYKEVGSNSSTSGPDMILQCFVSRTFCLPWPGTPRCMAVHPSTPEGGLLGVGVKLFDDAECRRGYVAFFPV